MTTYRFIATRAFVEGVGICAAGTPFETSDVSLALMLFDANKIEPADSETRARFPGAGRFPRLMNTPPAPPRPDRGPGRGSLRYEIQAAMSIHHDGAGSEPSEFRHRPLHLHAGTPLGKRLAIPPRLFVVDDLWGAAQRQ